MAIKETKKKAEIQARGINRLGARGGAGDIAEARRKQQRNYDNTASAETQEENREQRPENTAIKVAKKP